jgi:hypothetical protein
VQKSLKKALLMAESSIQISYAVGASSILSNARYPHGKKSGAINSRETY